MGCGSCSTTKNGVPQGCGDKGHCSSGSCNKMNTFDWLTDLDVHDPLEYKYVEVSFKKGARKAFFMNEEQYQNTTGDMVIVESDGGYDVGRISLSGELVRAQMKKRRVDSASVSHKVVRKANHRDLEKLDEARKLEKDSMIRSRAISRSLGLEMKVGDVEYRGDKRKATFYYTAEGRIDFRELVRQYAKEFRVKIEMRQIGARQESAMIGGIGSCGRELCCSTWLSDFKSVSTTAARYQNIAINQSKLSGQCGRLKCCLNYELDTYLDAIAEFPKKADYLKTEIGKAKLIKIDIFKRIMHYAYISERGRTPAIALDVDRVKEILAMNKKGETPSELGAIVVKKNMGEDEVFDDQSFAADDLTGVIDLPAVKKKKGRNRNNRNKKRKSNKGRNPTAKKEGSDTSSKSSKDKPTSQKKRPSRNNRNRNKKSGNKPDNKPNNNEN